jgi:hypothetical protein
MSGLFIRARNGLGKQAAQSIELPVRFVESPGASFEILVKFLLIGPLAVDAFQEARRVCRPALAARD